MDGVSAINQINDDIGVNWLISFLSADKKKTYCLYEASSADAIREAAARAGLPADVIIEVGAVHPSGDVSAVDPCDGRVMRDEAFSLLIQWVVFP